MYVHCACNVIGLLCIKVYVSTWSTRSAVTVISVTCESNFPFPFAGVQTEPASHQWWSGLPRTFARECLPLCEGARVHHARRALWGGQGELQVEGGRGTLWK